MDVSHSCTLCLQAVLTETQKRGASSLALHFGKWFYLLIWKWDFFIQPAELLPRVYERWQLRICGVCNSMLMAECCAQSPWGLSTALCQL